MAKEALYIVDGSGFVFRAFHALPPLMTSKGVPTGAVYGFAQMLLKLEMDEQPSHLVVVFDKGRRSFRNELYADYKANRAETPPDLVPQFEWVRRIVDAMALPVLEMVGYEADDVIASLVKNAHAAALPVVIVSSDKDLMQLIDDETAMIDTMRRDQRFGAAEVEEKFGVPPAQVADVLSLMGDSVDNVPGVPGVGPKTAAQLVRHFGSVDAMLQKLDEIPRIPGLRGAAGVGEKIRAHVDNIRLSQKLVALDAAVPVPADLAAFRRKEPQLANLVPIARELEFEKLIDRFRPKDGGVAGGAASSGPSAPGGLFAPTRGVTRALTPPTVGTEPAPIAAWLETLAPTQLLSIAVELGAGSALAAPVLALALAADGRAPLYLPLGHRYIGAPQLTDRTGTLALLAPILADPARPKIVYDKKTTELGLRHLGLALDGVVGDPQLAAYLLDAGGDHELPAIAKQRLDLLLRSRVELTGTGKKSTAFEMLDVSVAAPFVAARAEAQLWLWPLLEADLTAQHELELLRTLELPLASLLGRIEETGVMIDVPVLHRLSEEAAAQLAELEREIAELTGSSINLGSPKQLQELLFQKLGLPATKKTKTGYSTDADVLEELAPLHPAIDKILRHREISKLKGTYLDALPQLVDARTGRLHTSYQQTIAATGRLSSTEPNLQNVPVRQGLGKKIRAAFIAPEGAQLVVADYSQIELRVLAHLSNDRVLVDAFGKGQDIHERTVAEMFGEAKRHDPELRRVAKMINYGIVYGLSDFGLAQRLGIPRTEAKQYIEQWNRTYSGVQRYMNDLVAEARQLGGARTLLGRFRPLPELQQKAYAVRQYGERMAKNTPIQGTAADLLKLAMINVDRALATHAGARMLLTVHDELVFETPTPTVDAVVAVVRREMEQVMQLSVPLVVEVGVGRTWADCKAAKVVHSSGS